MSATARTTSSRAGSTRTSGHRTSGHRASGHRTGVLRTGAVRAGVRGSAGTATTGAAPRLGAGQRNVPVRPDLRLVPGAAAGRGPRSAPAARRAPFVLLIVALLAGTTLSLLVLNTAIAVDSLKATSLRKENARRVDQVQALQRKVVDGSTPQRLAAQASAAGLVPAGTPGYLVVQPDGTSVLRGTPTPARAPAPPPAPSPAPAQNAPAQNPAVPTSPAPAQPTDPDTAGD